MNNGLSGLLTPTLEERLAAKLRQYGPFVAIGRPGEDVPEGGATRMYVGNNDWQDVVVDLLSRPGTSVVFQAGGTAGLRWELETVARFVRPEQVLVFLPFAVDASAKQAEEQYLSFRAWAKKCLPFSELPARLEQHAGFLYFEKSGRSHLLTAAAAIPQQHALAELLKTLQNSKDFRHRPLFLLRRDWWRLIFLNVVFAILAWVIYLNVQDGEGVQRNGSSSDIFLAEFRTIFAVVAAAATRTQGTASSFSHRRTLRRKIG